MGTRSGRRAGVLREARGALSLIAAMMLLLALPSAAVRADGHEIAITDNGFEPAEITVFVGEPVTWTNATSSEHSVFIAVGVLDSGPILPGKSFTNVFQTTGTLAYHDGSNPAVVGTIIVVAPSQVTNGSPSARPTASVVQSGGNGPALFLAVAVVGVIAVAAALAGLIGASRRPGR